jgi:ribosome-binding protein aMBF1 (putative translation factor)
MAKSKFQPRGIGAHAKGGVYTCDFCGKRTRETGHGESDLGICADCYLKAGDENAVSDGDMTPEEFIEIWGHEPEGS